MGIRPERRLCEEVHLNPAWRWFCRLDLTDSIPDHSTFPKNRHRRFRDSELLRHLFEGTVARCIAEGLVGGQAFGVDASVVQSDAKRLNKVEATDWTPKRITRATDEYFETLGGAYGNAETPGWLFHENGIEPHVPVLDKSKRENQTFSRADFRFDHHADRYLCPGGKELLPSRRQFQTIRPQVKDDDTVRCRSQKSECDTCELKYRCCPKTPTRAVNS